MNEPHDDRALPSPEPQAVCAEPAKLTVNAPWGFFGFASRFLTAAEDLLRTKHRGHSVVIGHLVCHGLELALKGYLSLKGFSSDTLKDHFGHDLSALCEESERHGLVIGADERDDLRYANEIYHKKGLEYLVNTDSLGVLLGARTETRGENGQVAARNEALIPRLPRLLSFARRVVDGLPPMLKGSP